MRENLLTKITVDVSTWSKSRTLLYHAIQMARADQNYSLEEQLAVKKAAKPPLPEAGDRLSVLHSIFTSSE